MSKHFPNGFENWAESHHIIVEEITRAIVRERLAFNIELNKGYDAVVQFIQWYNENNKL